MTDLPNGRLIAIIICSVDGSVSNSDQRTHNKQKHMLHTQRVIQTVMLHVRSSASLGDSHLRASIVAQYVSLAVYGGPVPRPDVYDTIASVVAHDKTIVS